MSRRLRKKEWSLIWTVILIVIAICNYYGVFGSLGTSIENNNPGLYTVVSYSDGDTITVDMNGVDEEIRFIGVDTPETHDPRKNVQCGGPEASAYTKAKISRFGKVRLQSDALSSNRDRYNRLLRYVYLPDGTLMNQNLIRTGHGFAYTYFPFTKSALFTKLENEAIQAKKGLWAYCQPIPNEFGGYTSNDL